MPLTEAHVGHLVLALLSVNQYPLDTLLDQLPRFRARGLLDPARVASMPQDELAQALIDAGYARGGYLPIVTFRLAKLMELCADGALDGLPALDEAAFKSKLSSLHGFGPKTSALAWRLWSTD